MMATFMFVMMPRAEVCAERIEEVLDTESSVVPPADPVTDRGRARRRWSCAASTSATRAPRQPVLRGVDLVAQPGRDHRDHRQHRQRQDHADQPGPAAVRRDRRHGPGRRRRRARARPGRCCPRTVGLVPQKPYLFSGTVASNLRYGRPDATDEELWQALEIAQARDFVERAARAARRADRPGRQQRLRRPAPAAGDRPGAGAPARRSTSSTTRSRRWTTPPTPRCGPRWPGRPPTRPW